MTAQEIAELQELALGLIPNANFQKAEPNYFSDDRFLRSSNVLGNDFASATNSTLSPFRFGSLLDYFLTEFDNFMKQSHKELGTDKYQIQTDGGASYSYDLDDLQELFEAQKQFNELEIFKGKNLEFQKVIESKVLILGTEYKAKIKIDIVCDGLAYDLKTSSSSKKDGSQSTLTVKQNAQMWFYSVVSCMPFHFLIWNRNSKTFSFQSVDLEKGRKTFINEFLKKQSENPKFFEKWIS